MFPQRAEGTGDWQEVQVWVPEERAPGEVKSLNMGELEVPVCTEETMTCYAGSFSLDLYASNFFTLIHKILKLCVDGYHLVFYIRAQ